MAAAGEVQNAIRDGLLLADHVLGEIGVVLLGRVPGRESTPHITLYQSLSVARKNFVAAHLAFELAAARGVGLDVHLAQQWRWRSSAAPSLQRSFAPAALAPVAHGHRKGTSIDVINPGCSEYTALGQAFALSIVGGCAREPG